MNIEYNKAKFKLTHACAYVDKMDSIALAK